MYRNDDQVRVMDKGHFQPLPKLEKLKNFKDINLGEVCMYIHVI